MGFSAGWLVPFGQIRLSHRSKGFSEITEETVRLRRGCRPLIGLQRLAKLFPFLEEGSVRGFLLIELFGLALALIGANEILQGGLALCDCILGTADFRLQFADAVLHLLALDRIHAFGLGRRGGGRGLITISGRLRCGFNFFQLPADRFILLGAPALFTPEIIFIVAGIDFDFAVSDFENARSQLVDEVTVVRDEDDRARVFHQRIQQTHL